MHPYVFTDTLSSLQVSGAVYFCEYFCVQGDHVSSLVDIQTESTVVCLENEVYLFLSIGDLAACDGLMA